jgi:hypothetical protein
VLFDLPGYRVLDAVDTDDGRRQVKIASTTLEAGCPACGVLSARVHQRVEQRLTRHPDRWLRRGCAGPAEVRLHGALVRQADLR